MNYEYDLKREYICQYSRNKTKALKYDMKYKDYFGLLYITFRKTEIQAYYGVSMWAEQDSALIF